MFIVKVNGRKHSVWSTRQEARKQADTLRDHGYKVVSIVFSENTDYGNGQYFI